MARRLIYKQCCSVRVADKVRRPRVPGPYTAAFAERRQVHRFLGTIIARRLFPFQRMIARSATSCSASAGQSHISVSDLVSRTKYCFKPAAKTQQIQSGIVICWILLEPRCQADRAYGQETVSRSGYGAKRYRERSWSQRPFVRHHTNVVSYIESALTME